ncbi:amidohydrolase family protein [Saccharopolyspora hirsuta]|uniref:Amidohydrolase family protein n=1 Tax=Saccharopolyspora hirsuta TaxID=1837 RepID=A0A5M7C8X8_SACHI|nr:amidohydrolase family protein [Saccharopolyspora hirsuta]
MRAPEGSTRGAADLVLRGGVVRTITDQHPDATAIALRGGRIVHVGDDREVLAHAGPGTGIIDLSGRAVLPGINDAHLHATWLGALWPRTLFDGDSARPWNPLRTNEQRRAAILRAGELLSSLGITSYTEPGLGPGEDDGPTGAFGSSVVGLYRELAAEGRLNARVTVLSLYGELDGRSSLPDVLAGLAAHRSSADPRWLRFAGVKIFADGIPPMRSAYTNCCYADGTAASLLVDGDDDADREGNLARMVAAAHRAGLQVGVHATGDRSIDVVLDAVERAQAERAADLGHYVIHGDMANSAQLQRMAALGVGLDVQPGIALRTRDQVDAVLGPGSAAAFWRLGEALERGVRMCVTSDAPVLSPDWRCQIAAADEWLGPASDLRQRMAQLLRCCTAEPASQDGAAAWKGVLAPGMAADLCVLAADPLAVAPGELPEVDVDLTVVDGRIVHDRTGIG